MKKRAFVRYSKKGKIVPGSLILTSGTYPKGPAIWNEVPADLCCNPPCVPQDFGKWSPVTGGVASDGTILVDGSSGNAYTFIGPNDSEDSGWAYLTQYFASETCLEIEYDYMSFDGTIHDYPVYWTSGSKPTGEPGDITNRITTNPETGTWEVTVPAGSWFSIGLYSDDSCCGRGFLSISVDVVPCPTTTTTTLEPTTTTLEPTTTTTTLEATTTTTTLEPTTTTTTIEETTTTTTLI